MIRKLSMGVCILFVASGLCAANKEQERLEKSGVVMEEIINTPENIPQEILEKAECVIVFPSVLKPAVGFGGSYGRGAMVCRTGEHFQGAWGAPAMYALEGGSFGFQLGGQATDLVLLVMNDRGAQSILSSKGVSVSGSDNLDYRGLAAITTKEGFFTNTIARLSGATLKDDKLQFPFHIGGTIENPLFSKGKGD
jgi:lipid-binding SYLF domain-containing protein